MRPRRREHGEQTGQVLEVQELGFALHCGELVIEAGGDFRDVGDGWILESFHYLQALFHAEIAGLFELLAVFLQFGLVRCHRWIFLTVA